MYSYETSYGEGYWAGGLYIVRACIGLVTANKISSSLPSLLVNLLLDLLTMIVSLVLVILVGLNITYTPYDLTYFYHGELSILLSLYYSLLTCGALAGLSSLLSGVAAITSYRGKWELLSSYFTIIQLALFYILMMIFVLYQEAEQQIRMRILTMETEVLKTDRIS